jgi:hypothetical protein
VRLQFLPQGLVDAVGDEEILEKRHDVVADAVVAHCDGARGQEINQLVEGLWAEDQLGEALFIVLLEKVDKAG